ncbi:CAT RNA binding domain-containing protein [Corynebacterium sputi]|uniref:CAT RNA binding domain-containing protein n=1 Tax=Corynebacterium sputi TaxID=489915 RepID=UPI0003FCE51F|nr:CAT RNA binding domain-containing protein [Corynebacterium sputi]
MRILRVFNNNVVLANHSGTEVVLTGRGLGFGASAGDPVDESKVVRMFVPEDHREPDHVAALAADIPPRGTSSWQDPSPIIWRSPPPLCWRWAITSTWQCDARNSAH